MHVALDSLVVTQMALGAAADIAFALIVGAWLLGIPGWRHQRTVRLAVVGWLVAQACYLPLQAGQMTCGWGAAAWHAIPLVLAHSHFGTMWAIGLAAGIVALISLCLRPGGPLTRAVHIGLQGVALAVIAFTHAGTTHAADAGDFSLPELVHMVHLLATAGWAGAVIAAALPLRRWLSGGSADRALRLSNVATATFAIAIAAGGFDAYRGLGGSLAPVTESLWGELLIVKLIVVISAVAIGAMNRLVYLAGMKSGDIAARDGFMRLLTVEALLMVVVLSAASVLGHSIPEATG
jgi:putative copper resistance protein D